MRQFFNFIQQYPFVIYIVIFVGVPMLGRIIKGVKDKRREAERKRMVQRAEMESLRTGRAPGTPEYASSPRPAAPQANYPQPAPPTTYQAPPAAPPPTTARAGQPRYVQLPGGVILELPPAPTGPSAGSSSPPRPAPPAARPAPSRSASQRQPAPRPTPRAPAPRTPAPRPQQPQRSQAPRPGVQTTQQTAARRQAAEDQSRAQLQVRDREEREAEERRRQSEERQRAKREEQQRQQTDKIVAEAYRQDASAAGDRATNAVNVGKLSLKTRDFRRILLLREIMDPPVSMRDEF